MLAPVALIVDSIFVLLGWWLLTSGDLVDSRGAEKGVSMKTFYAMRRANGDWYAVADKADLRIPIFNSSSDATTARLRDSGMDCFRSVAFDQHTLKELKRTDGQTASFLLIDDPSRHLKHGLRLGFTELAPFMVN